MDQGQIFIIPNTIMRNMFSSEIGGRKEVLWNLSSLLAYRSTNKLQSLTAKIYCEVIFERHHTWWCSIFHNFWLEYRYHRVIIFALNVQKIKFYSNEVLWYTLKEPHLVVLGHNWPHHSSSLVKLHLHRDHDIVDKSLSSKNDYRDNNFIMTIIIKVPTLSSVGWQSSSPVITWDHGTISLTFTTRRKMGILQHVVNQFHKAYDTFYIMSPETG